MSVFLGLRNFSGLVVGLGWCRLHQWTFALEGVKGEMRDPKEAIQHHGTLMMMAGLAQFAMMGQSHGASGNRSLGETISDFFFMGLQATADSIARRVSATTVRRLVAHNFGDKVKPERCPKLTPQRIMALKFDAIVDALGKLGTADILTPTPELEAWIRREMGAPESDKATIIRERAKTAVSVPAGAGDGGQGPGKDGLRGEVREPGGGRGKTAPDLAVAASEGGTMREARGVEKCLAASEIISRLDQGRDDVAAALRMARQRVQAGIINRLIALPVRKMHRASVEADAKVTGAVKGILEGIAGFGKKQIGDERARQLAGRPAPTAAVVRGADADQEPVGLYADAVVSEWENVLQARATSAMMARRVRQNASVGELITGVGEDLDEQSDKWVDSIASKGANEAFAAGRDEGFAEYADEIDRYVYSAMLDFNCCGNCAAADGAEGTEDEVPSVPNEECDGGDRCRCVIVAVFKDEGSVTT